MLGNERESVNSEAYAVCGWQVAAWLEDRKVP